MRLEKFSKSWEQNETKVDVVEPQASAPSHFPLRRTGEVAELLGVSKATIWRLVRDGRLPQPVRLTTQTVVWRNSDLEGWASDLRSDAEAGYE